MFPCRDADNWWWCTPDLHRWPSPALRLTTDEMALRQCQTRVSLVSNDGVNLAPDSTIIFISLHTLIQWSNSDLFSLSRVKGRKWRILKPIEFPVMSPLCFSLKLDWVWNWFVQEIGHIFSLLPHSTLSIYYYWLCERQLRNISEDRVIITFQTTHFLLYNFIQTRSV